MEECKELQAMFRQGLQSHHLALNLSALNQTNCPEGTILQMEVRGYASPGQQLCALKPILKGQIEALPYVNTHHPFTVQQLSLRLDDDGRTHRTLVKIMNEGSSWNAHQCLYLQVHWDNRSSKDRERQTKTKKRKTSDE